MVLFGVGVLIVVWTMLVAGIAKLAQSRGRFVAGWALGAAATGALGFTAGLALVARAVDHDDADGFTRLAALTPAGFLVGSMLAVGLVLQWAPVKVSHRNEWSVHFVKQGAGRILINGIFSRLGDEVMAEIAGA